MRTALPLLALTLFALGCQSASHSPAIPGVDSLTQSLPTYDLRAGEESLVAMFAVTVDPATMSATAAPIRGAQAQPPQGQTYDLDIDRFLTSQTFKIVGLETDGAGDFVVTFSHAHPFPACNVANPPTALNRADLGYTGRLMLLVNNDPVSFFANEVILDPNTIVAPDGYIQPGDLLAQIGEITGAAYPYVLLADDGEDNRVNLPNGGPKGNYDTAISGWQRSNIGINGEGWTGYDYVHGGQVITNTFTVSAAALAGGTQTFGAAILIKYTDPRGAGGPVNRIPPEPKKVLDFAYRLPYAALDASVVSFTGLPQVKADAGEETELSFEVRDWDAKAVEAADSKVGDENNVALVQLGASGAPAAQFHCPALRNSAVNISVLANSRTGSAGSELQYQGTITNSLGTATPGIYPGVLRLIDPEDGDAEAANYHFGVDPVTLAGSPARALKVRTYQVIPVEVIEQNPPVISSVLPTGTIGIQGTQTFFVATASNSPTGWTWNFGGGATPNTSTVAAPQVVLGAPGIFNGTVRASNASGTSAVFNFAYTIGIAITDKPTVSVVLPQGTVGGQGASVKFGAIASNSPTSWSWNFGGGATPNTSTNATPTVTLGSAGSYSGNVIATNALGSSASFPFSFTVEALTGPPIISDVFPTGVAGGAGDQIVFGAVASNGPTSWSWNFGGGASPNTSSAAAPSVTLGAAGAYNGTVTATNAIGTSPSFPFSYTVNAVTSAPEVMSVSPTGPVACGPGEQITFSAVVTNSPTSYAWTFGPGMTPQTSSNPSPTVTSSTSGNFDASLIATNAFGPSETFFFKYGVKISWHLDDFAPTNAQKVDGVLYGGRPVVAMTVDGASDVLSLYIPSSGAPHGDSDWSSYPLYTLPDGLETFARRSMQVVDGHLAVFFYTSAQLLVAISQVQEPVMPTASDWEIYTVLDGGRDGTAAVINNRLAVLASSGTNELGIYTATVAMPQAATDWTLEPAFLSYTSALTPEFLGSYQPLGSPGPLRVAFGIYSDGKHMRIEGGTAFLLANANNQAREGDAGILTTGPDPRLWCARGDSPSAGVLVATVPIPTGAADFVNYQIGPASSGIIINMGSYEGRAFVQFNSSKVYWSTTAIPLESTDWQEETVLFKASPSTDQGSFVVLPENKVFLVTNNQTAGYPGDILFALRECVYEP